MINKFKRDFYLPPAQPHIWVLLGLILVSLIFWNRFLRLRWPRELSSFSWYWVVPLMLGFLFIFFWTLKNTYYPLWENQNLRHWLNRPIPSWLVWVGVRGLLAPQEFLGYFLGKLVTLERILPGLPKLVEWLEPLSSVPAMKIITWFLILGPPLIPPLVMHVEIIFNQKLHYFYPSLFLLALPLFLGSFLALLRYTVNYGRWLIQEKGVVLLNSQDGPGGKFLELDFPSSWPESQMDLWGQTHSFLWTLANWEDNIFLLRQQYGPFFTLTLSALYFWNWLLILTYLMNLW